VEKLMNKIWTVAAVAACLPIGACGESVDRVDVPPRDSVSPVSEATSAGVEIVSPTDGDLVESGDVTVRLEVEGLVVVPAGVEQPASGHHHLIVDAPLPDLDRPIPAEAGRYIHLGKGQTEFVLEGLTAGPHEVIALMGDHLHVPLSPPVADTVRFVVR
jgi:hypothetical protein